MTDTQKVRLGAVTAKRGAARGSKGGSGDAGSGDTDQVTRRLRRIVLLLRTHPSRYIYLARAPIGFGSARVTPLRYIPPINSKNVKGSTFKKTASLLLPAVKRRVLNFFLFSLSGRCVLEVTRDNNNNNLLLQIHAGFNLTREREQSEREAT